METDYISKILEKPWATQMLSLYGEDKKKVLRWSDFKKNVKMNDKLLGERLKKLCYIGILRKKLEEYRYCSKYPLSYIFKSEDIKLIQNCPSESIYSMKIPVRRKEGREVEIRCLSFYGLEKPNPDLIKIISPVRDKLDKYIDSMYSKKLQTIIDDECKKIKNKHFIKLIRNWYNIINKNMTLLPMQIKDKKIHKEIQCDVPEKYREEFKKTTEKIWGRLSQESQPFGIMFRF